MLSNKKLENRVAFPCVTCRACELVRVKLACGVRVCLESVSRFSSCCCSCCCSRPLAPLVSRRCPVHFFIFSFSTFPFSFILSAAVRCGVAALASGVTLPTSLSAIWLVVQVWKAMHTHMLSGTPALGLVRLVSHVATRGIEKDAEDTSVVLDATRPTPCAFVPRHHWCGRCMEIAEHHTLPLDCNPWLMPRKDSIFGMLCCVSSPCCCSHADRDETGSRTGLAMPRRADWAKFTTLGLVVCVEHGLT